MKKLDSSVGIRACDGQIHGVYCFSGLAQYSF